MSRAPRRRRAPRRPRASVPALQPPAPVAVEASAPLVSIVAQPGGPAAAPWGLATWIKSNKLICWLAFWVGWFALSPATIIPGAVAVGVGVVFYKERALNLVTASAAWLGILAYLALGHNLAWFPDNVRLWMGVAAIFALIVLGKRFPMFGLFLIIMITSALSRGRRRW